MNVKIDIQDLHYVLENTPANQNIMLTGRLNRMMKLLQGILQEVLNIFMAIGLLYVLFFFYLLSCSWTL